MDKATWTTFRKTVKRYRDVIEKTAAAVPGLAEIIQKLVDGREGPSYTVDTPVVYNMAIDEITPESEIKMILVGDNPGRREQAAENRRYLVGPSGKIAEKFFRDNPELGIDFRKHVLILNKTPIHTPRTSELKKLCALGGETLEEAVLSSQKAMAKLLLEFWKALSAKNAGRHGAEPRGGGSGESFKTGTGLKIRSEGDTSPHPIIWIIGYSEMKKGGIFEGYTETLKTLCGANAAFGEAVYFFRHFSMNQFVIDLKNRHRPGEGLAERLGRIGKAYRERVLG